MGENSAGYLPQRGSPLRNLNSSICGRWSAGWGGFSSLEEKNKARRDLTPIEQAPWVIDPGLSASLATRASASMWVTFCRNVVQVNDARSELPERPSELLFLDLRL